MREISEEELAEHDAASSSQWICIDGKVYDVTKWMSSHPGGDLALKSFAGQDASQAFLAFHPPNARAELPRFWIGTLRGYAPGELSADYRSVHELLRKRGLMEVPRRWYLAMAAAVALLLSACVAGVLLSSSRAVHVGCAVLLGIAWIQLGFIGHDAGHTGIVGSRFLDSCLGLLVGNCLTGIAIGWWSTNHNAHHFSCNSLDYDPDVQYVPLFAVSSKLFASLYSHFYQRRMAFDGLAKLLVSYQHWTFYLVMAVARINLYVQSFLVVLFSPRLSWARRAAEAATLAVFWTWLPCLLWQLPTAGERAAFLLISLATTGVQHVQFCLNHFSSPVYSGPPRAADWCRAQASGTLNIVATAGRGAALADIFHGGLHFQLEHHLFPRIPRPNLRAAAAIIKPLLVDKHRLPYVAISFFSANRMLLVTLRSAALQARRLPAAAPPPKNLVWEAVNAIG